VSSSSQNLLSQLVDFNEIQQRRHVIERDFYAIILIQFSNVSKMDDSQTSHVVAKFAQVSAGL
jgi:hypothetical protein